MEETKVKNTLKDKEVQVREGNHAAGVTRLVATLKLGASKRMRSDPNATYREYIITTLPDGTKLPTLNSDDFAAFKQINIVEEDGKVDWKGTVLRRPERQRGLFRRILSRSFTFSLMLMGKSIYDEMFAS